ncbi:MAG: hypothetical protein ABII01_03320 [Candidatus Woesearchaeota archaeon]
MELTINNVKNMESIQNLLFEQIRNLTVLGNIYPNQRIMAKEVI